MNLPPASRSVLGSIGAVLAGGVSAALFAVALMHVGTVLVFLAYLSSLPLFVAGLSAGSIAGFIASATAIAGLYVVQPELAMSYTIINALPAMVLTALALRHHTTAGSDQTTSWYPEGFLMVALTLYPCAIFLTVVGLTSSSGGLLALTMATLNQTVDILKPHTDADFIAQFMAMMDRMAKFLPAFAAAAWMIITMGCMLIGQTSLQKNQLNIRPRFSLRELHVPTSMIFAVAITGAVAAFGKDPYDYVGLNLAIILGMPFFFVGLAVIHAWAATTKHPKLTLSVFYVVASFVFWSALLVAALGVIDQWVNFRQRFAVRPKQT